MTVDQIVELIDICLKTTYFSFMGIFFKQQDGCAMGSPVSPIVANLCMETFEINALDSYSGTRPKLWLRYVDDTFPVLEREETDQFLQHLNSLDPTIKFTQENLTSNSLPFLDCLVTVNEDGSLSTSVYRKSTHTDQYLQFDSHHLSGAPNESVPHIICSPEESCWLAKMQSGPSRRRVQGKDRLTTQGQGQTTRANITIPYVAGISEKIKNAFKAHGISTCYKHWNTLRQKLVRVKDSVPKAKRANTVYGVKCGDKDCQERYVGETQQSLGARMNQHRRPSFNPAQTSAVYTHLNFTGHAFTLTDVVVLDREDHWHRRGVKEAIWERVENPFLNRKGGLRHSLSHTWDRTVRLICSRLSRGTSVT
ncbi:uncharacterized protein [Montipora foliosa]|uniref:uncharacterized protein n=1 Tax=Montipora foliosa TaxID=591990 RepID=UPI0035F1DD6C